MGQRRKNMNRKDAYDGDHNTVSPYDNMEKHEHLDKYDKDFGNPLAGWEGAQISAMAQRRRNKYKKDMYDFDPQTVSPYDGMEIHKYVDKYEKDYGIDTYLSSTDEIKADPSTYFMTGDYGSDISIYMGSNSHYVIYPVNQNNEYNFVAIIKKKLSSNH